MCNLKKGTLRSLKIIGGHMAPPAPHPSSDGSALYIYIYIEETITIMLFVLLFYCPKSAKNGSITNVEKYCIILCLIEVVQAQKNFKTQKQSFHSNVTTHFIDKLGQNILELLNIF